MKSGRTLVELAQELQRQTESRKDYVAPQGVIEAEIVNDDVSLVGVNGVPLQLTNHAHRQMGDHLEIPRKYYDRMRAQRPDLLVENINGWLKHTPAEKRLVRTLDGKVRAFLSNRYRALDNFELANAVLPTLLANKVDITSSELTETRMYIKGILPELSDELPNGMAWGHGHNRVDGLVVAAITISNSEVGDGSLRVEPGVFTPWCTNLATLVESAMRKYHVGRTIGAGEFNFEVFKDETRKLADKAFFEMVKDTVVAAFDKDAFRAAIADIKATVDRSITSNDLPKVVEVTAKKLALPEDSSKSILSFLTRGGDLSQWGLASAITATANNTESYELATDLEHAGGKVLALTGPQWEEIATAA